MLGKMPDSGRLISIESLFTRIAIRQFLCDAIPIDPRSPRNMRREAECKMWLWISFRERIKT